ncbi:MAG TPA: YkgJ family cysteine cluster protein, partial [Polyangiaceae bacterium]
MADVHDARRRGRAAASAGLLLSASVAPSAAPQTEWSHHCSACGKCCNSPPQLSVPELFHHQRRFIGCLSVRWLGEPAQLLLGARAYDTELSEHCPALDGERHCRIHDDHKPAVCRVVPFDEQLPDHLQHLVLAERAAEARYMGSDCIAPGTRAGFPVVTRRLELVDEGARAALTARRRDLANDQRFWGKSLTPLL